MDLKGKKALQISISGVCPVEVECGGFVTDASLLGELGPPGQSLRLDVGGSIRQSRESRSMALD